MPSTDYNSIFSDGINRHAGLEYAEAKQPGAQIFAEEQADGRVIRVQNWELHGRPTRRNPGEVFDASSFKESYGKTVVIVNYGMFDSIAQEDIDDDKYNVIHRVLPLQGGSLGRSFAVNEELARMELLMNYGWTSSTGLPSQFDGKSLFNTAHPVSKSRSGTTVSNRPSSDIDLSIAALDAARTNLVTQYAANYLARLMDKPKYLCINPAQNRVATQVCKGEWERATADRNMNVLKDYNISIVELPYFVKSGATGTNNAWFVLGENHQLRQATRQGFKVVTDKDITTNSLIWLATQRFEVYWSDFRSTYGSLGA